jgi:hypothetical protein
MTREEVREKIAHWLQEHTHYAGNLKWEDFDEDAKEGFRCQADQILAIEGIRIEAENQDLPSYDLPDKPLAKSEWWSGYATGHIEGKEAMLKADFVKCLPRQELPSDVPIET